MGGKRIEHPDFLVQQGAGRMSVRLGDLVDHVAKEISKKVRASLPARQKPLPRQSKPIPKKAKRKKILTSGKLVRGHKFRPIVDDEQYGIDLRKEPCTFTGLYGTEDDPVEGMHIGNIGKGVKSDNEQLPARHSIHSASHTKKTLKVLIPYLEQNESLLRDILRAYAREKYAIAKAEQGYQEIEEEGAQPVHVVLDGLRNILPPTEAGE